ncbi:uncharacterized protein LOC129921630 isoform X1 [Biomphalaria glabrata]|uniref:Uncharacterized protein LOC129921630 isoform X1 n=1 Tax=Biomphalaria glabrata TaxID=6526 RepID=A0A9W2YA92_BIOGL|nr:uncharacterized protein LOC129921630 isoform X1 [Biomphalaria glabrata]
MDWLLTGLTSLTKLTRLSISLNYLTDECILSLAQARRGELTYLSLWTTHVFPLSPVIQYNSWKYLVKSCPGMEVAFRIVGFVSEPHLSLTRLFDSVLPVTKLKIQIDRKYDPLTRPAYRMDIALEHVRQHYGTRLTSFKLGVDNQKEYFDQSLIKFQLLINGEIQLIQLNESSQRDNRHLSLAREGLMKESALTVTMGAKHLDLRTQWKGRLAFTERLNNSLKT